MVLERRVGIGFRAEIATELLERRAAVEFVEVVAEGCFANRAAHRQARAVAEVWPVVPHGVKLSLGSPDGLDDARVGKLGALARELGAPCVSEHVAFTRGGPIEIGHLTMLPRSREAIRVVARNVARARRRLPDVPFLLENVAFTVRLPGDEMDEATFYAEVSSATGCPLLLDLGNLYANALNEGRDPLAVLRGYPLEGVGMVHLAGGVLEDGFYFDTHADPVPDEVFVLVGALFRETPDVPVLLERDGRFDDVGGILAELGRVRALRPAAAARIDRPPSTPAAASVEVPSSTTEGLLALQREVAALLTDRSPADGPLRRSLDEAAVRRARAVLERKRVDDALPLLGRLSLRAEALRPIAVAAMEAFPRVPRGAGPSDALRIAAAAAEDPRFADDAAHDALLLRARFRAHGPAGATSPRVTPYVGRTALSGGRSLWVVKGPGAFASVRLFERKAARWNEPSELSPRA